MLHNPKAQLCAGDYTVDLEFNYTVKSGKFMFF